MTTAPSSARSRGIEYAALALLWAVLLLHLFADRIWDQEPAVLRWAVIGFGGLVLLGLLGSVAFGKRDERLFAVAALAVIAVAVAFFSRGSDPRPDPEVEALVAELDTAGAEMVRRAEGLKDVPEGVTRSELEDLLRTHGEQVGDRADKSGALLERAEALLPRARGDQKARLGQAITRFGERTRAATDRQKAWLAQAQERVAALKKKAGEKR